MPCAEFTSAQLTSHRASRYGARLPPLTAVSASSRGAGLRFATLDIMPVSRVRASSSAASSLTRCEPRWTLPTYGSGVHHRESLATRGAAYEDALTLLPTDSVTAAAPTP